MPHCMCAACRIRCQSEGSAADVVGDLCPYCGSLLEPVTDLSAVVGFRRISLGDEAPDATLAILAPAVTARTPVVDRVDPFISRRGAVITREQQRNDGDLLYAAAVALPRPGVEH
jgi:hypothetical protein